MSSLAFPQIRRGDDWDYVATLALSAGSLVGCKVWLTLKTNQSQDDASAALQIGTDAPLSGITVLSATTIEIVLTAAQTAALAARKYFVDIQVKTTDGKIITVDNLAEATTVEADVTRAIA